MAEPALNNIHAKGMRAKKIKAAEFPLLMVLISGILKRINPLNGNVNRRMVFAIRGLNSVLPNEKSIAFGMKKKKMSKIKMLNKKSSFSNSLNAIPKRQVNTPHVNMIRGTDGMKTKPMYSYFGTIRKT